MGRDAIYLSHGEWPANGESSTERHAFRSRKSARLRWHRLQTEQEGYVPTPEAEAVHRRVARWEITSEEAIRTFHDRALNQDTELSARNGDRRYQRHLWLDVTARAARARGRTRVPRVHAGEPRVDGMV